MSTEKSLKHLKSKDKFFKLFRERLMAGQLIIYSTYFSGDWAFSEYEKNF